MIHLTYRWNESVVALVLVVFQSANLPLGSHYWLLQSLCEVHCAQTHTHMFYCFQWQFLLYKEGVLGECLSSENDSPQHGVMCRRTSLAISEEPLFAN